MSRPSLCRFTLAFAVCLVLLASSGCASKGNVTGKVQYKGKPVLTGTVSVIASDMIQYSGQITDGAYSIMNVPAGSVKFFVSSPNPDGATRATPAGPRGGDNDLVPSPAAPPVAAPTSKWFPIPDKYADPQQSGLTGTVRAETIIDLDLQ